MIVYEHQTLINLMVESLSGKRTVHQLIDRDIKAIELYPANYFSSKRKVTGTLHAHRTSQNTKNGFEIRLSDDIAENFRLMEFVLWHEVAHTFELGKGFFGPINEYLPDPISSFWPDDTDSERLCDRFAATFCQVNTEKDELHEIFRSLVATKSFRVS